MESVLKYAGSAMRIVAASSVLFLFVFWGACSAAGSKPTRPSLKISTDGAMFEKPNGQPFLYLGDTAWTLIDQYTREDAILFLDDRAAKGFTVIQASALSIDGALATPNAYGDSPFFDFDPSRPNEAYFEHMDFVVEAANERGLFVAILPAWGPYAPSTFPGLPSPIFTVDNARAYGRFLGARYRDADVLWVLGGDSNPEAPGAIEIWSELAIGLGEGDGGRHLATYHPGGFRTSATWFHDDHWLDFNMYQSGHDGAFTDANRFSDEHLALPSRKPFLDGEPVYEDIPYKFWTYSGSFFASTTNADGRITNPGAYTEGFGDAYEVRRRAYTSLLAGAAGHVYGQNAVWQHADPGEEAYLAYIAPWRESLDQPGATAFSHIARLNAARPFAEFEPAQELIVGANPRGPEHIRAMRSRDWASTLIYASGGGTVRVEPAAVSSATFVGWFDPRTGALSEIALAGDGVFTAPSAGYGNDWLLIIDSSGAYDDLGSISFKPEAASQKAEDSAAENAAAPERRESGSRSSKLDRIEN